MNGVCEEKLSIINIGGGAAVEKFDIALQQVLDNIADPNTVENAVREIVLRVRFKPTDRSYARIEIDVPPPKLAGDFSYNTNCHIGADIHGRAEAYEHNPEQLKLQFEERQRRQQQDEKTAAEDSAGNVISISKKTK